MWTAWAFVPNSPHGLCGGKAILKKKKKRKEKEEEKEEEGEEKNKKNE